MRWLPALGLLALLAASTASAQEPATELEATIPPAIQRLDAARIALGPPYVSAGDRDGPVWLNVTLSRSDDEIGEPYRASWHVSLGDWCPAGETVVSPVLTGPSGQTWSGHGRLVPAGGFHPEEPRRLFGGSDDADLMAALDAGGRFTLALEDERGRRWDEVVIVLPDADARRRMNAANLALLRATDPASIPPRRREDRMDLVVVPAPPGPRPVRPRRDCSPD